MTKFILFTAGILSARYDLAINGNAIPEDAMPVSEDLFFQTINEQDGIWSLVDNKIVKLPLPQPSLDSMKASKKLDIEKWRDQARYSDITVAIGGNSHGWQADQTSKDLISDTINLVGNGVIPMPTTWRDADNVNATISLTDLKAIALAIAIQTSNAYSHSWDLKAQVDSASTQTQLNAIVW